ncbi:MAG: hypothetical protein ACFFC7_25550 [Candidatus Hermodarchaeota archaeon]
MNTKTREYDLFLEAKQAKQSSPEKRLDAVFEVLELSEELYKAARKEYSNNET